jgi:hypothetical protein
MSLEDLLRDEVQRQIDTALEDIEHDYNTFKDSNLKSTWEFIYGYEYGCIVTGTADYYRFKILGDRGTTLEQAKYATDQIKAIVLDRLPEIRQAITRAEKKLKDDHPT